MDKGTAGVLIGAAAVIFIIVEGLILSCFWEEAPAGADYCIVLGAQMKEHGPSDVLRRRLDRAIVYLEQNPDTKVIVSGGRGSNEPVTEAEGMADYLMKKGIDETRIIREELSVNTFSNLANSAELLDRRENSVAVVTNNFHMYRALAIARKMGYEKVSGLAADSYPGMVPNNLLREFFGVIKDFMAENL